MLIYLPCLQLLDFQIFADLETEMMSHWREICDSLSLNKV